MLEGFSSFPSLYGGEDIKSFKRVLKKVGKEERRGKNWA